MEKLTCFSIALLCLDVVALLQCQCAKLSLDCTLTADVTKLFRYLQCLFIDLARLRVLALIGQYIGKIGQQRSTHVNSIFILRLLAHQCLDHDESLAEISFSISWLPATTEATRQSKERHTVFVRARTQWSALGERFDVRQQCAEAGVGSTDLASLQLVLTQTTFAQILRVAESSTFLHPHRNHCLAYMPPQF